MSLEPIQIERVREIIGFTSYEATAALLDNLETIQESETAADIVLWNAVRDKYSRLEGGKFGITSDKADARLIIINRVRPRLGLSKITDENQLELNQAGAVCYSHPATPDSDCGC